MVSNGGAPAGQVGYFWSAARGDKVSQTFAGPAKINHATLHVQPGTNGLATLASWRLSINGVDVGPVFSVPPTGSLAPITVDAAFSPITGPGYAVQMRMINEVASGDGAHTWISTGGTGAHSIDLFANVPDTQLTSGPEAVATSNSATVTFNSAQPSITTGFQCSLDGGAYAACTSPKTYSGVGHGSHSIGVRAVGNTGDVDATPAVAAWTVDAQPICIPGSLTVKGGSVTTLTLPCSDPDGDDPGVSIVSGPGLGVLGAVQPGARVVYTAPRAGGTTAFSYSARSGPAGLTSNVATFTLTVLKAAVKRITTLVTNKWLAFPGYSQVSQLAVNSAPKGSKITVTCKGKGCPFKKKTTSAKKTGRVNLIKLFKHSKLKPKARVEVRITQADSIGRVARFTIRARALPKTQQLCLPVGSSKPKRSC
ncbi:MAG: putative internalin [Acidimicrobiales bacterium]|nr:putative internalin [Acidimicrobiales bacterium]